MPLYIHTIASFIASFCFCFLFSVPKRNTYLSALCGSVSWTILIFFQSIGINYIFATLAGALAVGLLADLFAVLQKTPVTCFIVIGTIPLVPGFKVYKTMLFFVTDKLEKGVSEGVQAAFIAIAISVGLIISASVTRLIKALKKKTTEKKINNPDASIGVCCSHKVVAVGFNTLRYDASVGVLNPPHE